MAKKETGRKETATSRNQGLHVRDKKSETNSQLPLAKVAREGGSIPNIKEAHPCSIAHIQARRSKSVSISRYIDKMIGYESADGIAKEFGRQRVQSVREFIKLYYIAIFLPAVALITEYWHHPTARILLFAITAIFLVRVRHWTRPVPPGQSEDENPTSARTTAAVVVILSCVQSILYIALSEIHESLHFYTGETILIIGLFTSVIQGVAINGIIFASRAILLCLSTPLLAAIIWGAPEKNYLVPMGLTGLILISFYVAESSHNIRLSLFRSQYKAGDALKKMKEANILLDLARHEALVRSEIDKLTELRNRFSFIDEVAARLKRGGGGLLAIIDLDRFKPVNDIYGHDVGDLVLMEIAERLRRSSSDDAIIGRLGGDEFAIFLPGKAGHEQSGRHAGLLNLALDEIRKPIVLASGSVTVGVSAGVRHLEADDLDVGLALKDADAALYIAKDQKLDTPKVFDEVIAKQNYKARALESALMSPSAIDEISLLYQPIFHLSSSQISSFEVLARWHHPALGEIPPAKFIPAAERLGKIREITLVLLDKALAFAAQCDGVFRLSINLSATHVSCIGAADDLIRIIRLKNFDPTRVQFEITETAILLNFEAARSNIERLRRVGCKIALDDFGAGYSSIAYLQQIEFDAIKIDGSLVRAARNAQGRGLLKGVIRMVQALEVECVAEYIATQADQSTAKQLGANFGQGHLLSPPLNAEQVRKFLAQSVSRNACTSVRHYPGVQIAPPFGAARRTM